MPRMVDRDDDDDEKCPHLGVSPPQLRHAPSVTIRHQQYDVLSHYWKYIFCENSDVRGFIWSSSALHNFLRCHVYRTILSLNHHEFRKW